MQSVGHPQRPGGLQMAVPRLQGVRLACRPRVVTAAFSTDSISGTTRAPAPIESQPSMALVKSTMALLAAASAVAMAGKQVGRVARARRQVAPADARLARSCSSCPTNQGILLTSCYPGHALCSSLMCCRPLWQPQKADFTDFLLPWPCTVQFPDVLPASVAAFPAALPASLSLVELPAASVAAVEHAAHRAAESGLVLPFVGGAALATTAAAAVGGMHQSQARQQLHAERLESLRTEVAALQIMQREELHVLQQQMGGMTQASPGWPAGWLGGRLPDCLTAATRQPCCPLLPAMRHRLCTGRQRPCSSEG